MRVLLLRRSARGGLAAWADDLSFRLPVQGIGATLEDATWIPRETGPATDREVTRRLKEIGDGYDLIHAFGYRAAWACAAAFGDDYLWAYSAYEAPPASPPLVAKLNLAGLGFCACALTRNQLSGQGVHSLDLIYPGVGDDAGVRLGRAETRRLLEVDEEAFVIGSFSDDGLVEAFTTLAADTNPPVLLLGGASSSVHEGVRQVGWFPRPRDLMGACDLWIGPDRNKGYVRNVVEAMREGVPVLIRENLRELIEEEVSGFVFLDDEALPKRIEEIRGMQLTRQTVGAAGRVRAIERYDVDERAADIAHRYRDLIAEIDL